MKCGARVALGVAGGYFLGRTRKMKLALMLSGLAAGRRAGGPGELLNQGTKLLGQSPELARLAEEVRGKLIEAGKNAALAVATRQVEALTDRVGRRVESLGEARVPGPRKGEEAPADDEPGAESAEQEEPGPDEGAPEDTAEPEEATEREAPAPRRPARARAATSAPRRTTATTRRAASSGGSGRAVRSGGESAGGRKPRTRRGESDG